MSEERIKGTFEISTINIYKYQTVIAHKEKSVKVDIIKKHQYKYSKCMHAITAYMHATLNNSS